MCENNATSCAYFTYYGPSSFPFMDACVFYDSCPVLDPCEDCYTEALGCYDFCAAAVEGALGDNIISVLDDVKNEKLCSESCDYDEQCNFYTYHRGNSSLYPSTCFLLSEIREPIRACDGDTCVSGTPNCQDSLCTFLEGGFSLQSGVLTIDDNTLVQTRDIDLLMLGSCPNPIIVAVGGGGDPLLRVTEEVALASLSSPRFAERLPTHGTPHTLVRLGRIPMLPAWRGAPRL